MRHFYSTIIVVSILCAASAVLAPWANAQGKPQVLVVIAAKELGITDLPLAVLRRAFSGELTDVAGKRVMPFNYGPSDAIRVAFDKVVLGMTPDVVGRYWIDRRIRGQSLPPKTVPSQQVLRALVAKMGAQTGAIGYVTADQLDATVQPVKIEGKAHTTPGYVLAMR
jgi:hypothetical protein